MKTIRGLMAVILLVVYGSAGAGGTYLLYLQNDSNAQIKVTANLPAGWVDTPPYPLSVSPKRILADERKYDEVKKSFDYYACLNKQSKYQVHKVRNVALPTWCESQGWPGPGEWKWLSIDGATDYRLYVCQGKVYVKKKVGNQWKVAASKAYEDHSGVGFFSIFIDSKGDLDLQTKW